MAAARSRGVHGQGGQRGGHLSFRHDSADGPRGFPRSPSPPVNPPLPPLATLAAAAHRRIGPQPRPKVLRARSHGAITHLCHRGVASRGEDAKRGCTATRQKCSCASKARLAA